MAGKKTAVFGIYTTRQAVEEGIECLRQANFRNEDISILFPENVGNKDFAHVKASKAPEGASTGAAQTITNRKPMKKGLFAPAMKKFKTPNTMTSMAWRMTCPRRVEKPECHATN